MRDVNKVILVGRLGADPVLRSTKSGTPVVNFPLATSRRIREGEDITQWHNVVAWGKNGENCASFLKKGFSVYIEGMVRSRKYEGKDGASRVAYEIHAESVNFLGRPAAKEDDDTSAQAEAVAQAS